MRTLVRLLSFVRPYRRLVLLGWIALIGAAVFSLLVPKIVGKALDSAVESQAEGELQWNPLLIAFAAVLLVAAFRGLFAFGQQYIGEKLSQSVAYSIRAAIYDQLQRLSFAYHDDAQIGQVMSRATQDVEAIRMYINMGVMRMLYILFLLVASLALMAQSNVKLALVSWSFLPLTAIVAMFAARRMRPYWTLVQDGMGRMSNVLQENLSGARVVKAFSREPYESGKFRAEAESLFDASYAQNQIQAFNTPLLNMLGVLALVATVWVGGRELAAGRLTTGDLLAFLSYLYILQQPMRMLGFLTNVLARTASAGERIYEILDAESAVQERPDARVLPHVEGRVAFDHVAFGYDRISPVLRDIAFEVEPGQVVALIGPTGSGKSTVVNLLPRFYDVSEGAIRIDDVDIRDLTLESLRASIGTVQQDVFLFIDTIRENIRYGRVDATDEEVEDAARVARIHDFITSLPEGYDTWVGERGVTLSGGQKQRIAIARTLVLDPAILVFDDSTSSVDMETEYLIQAALADLMQGRTTFVIAQRLRTVRDADLILVLDRGQIVERGRHEELLAADGLYRQIYDLELRDQEDAALDAERVAAGANGTKGANGAASEPAGSPVPSAIRGGAPTGVPAPE
ncbi:MAG: ABC transporter ATP-binding protein [Chloroflexi bacterium]|nr:ABC transporter ATP-binding protein [Chloroflexota bacterium]MDA1145756.1 ABC transporter ATP-binding protein [Chloroflexota bacterium]